VAQIVGYVSAALLAGNKTYSIIHKGMSERKLMRLNLRSEDNELAVLKILASVYRRARDLAKLQNKQKLDLQRAHIERSSNSKNQHDS